MANMENKPNFPPTIKELLAENIGATFVFYTKNRFDGIIVAVCEDYFVTRYKDHMGKATGNYRYTRIDSFEQFELKPEGASLSLHD